MNKLVSRISLVVAIAVVFAVSSVNAQSVKYFEETGNFEVTTAGGAAGVFIAGADWTGNCDPAYCDGTSHPGTDGNDYMVLLGYSGGAMENQWLFFNLFGTGGVDSTDAVFATVPGLTQDDVGTFKIGYGSGEMLPDFEGTVEYIPVPEPTSLLGFAALAVLGFLRRR